LRDGLKPDHRRGATRRRQDLAALRLGPQGCREGYSVRYPAPARPKWKSWAWPTGDGPLSTKLIERLTPDRSAESLMTGALAPLHAEQRREPLELLTTLRPALGHRHQQMPVD